MTIEQAFKHLLENWKDQDTEFVTKYRTYKSRFLNASGKQTKKVSEEKMIEMLREAGYKVDIKVKISLPNK
jgi:methanogenic corrinoid protein MtbC1